MKPPTKFQRRVKKLEDLMRDAMTKIELIDKLTPYQISGLAQFCGELAFKDKNLLEDEQAAVTRLADRYTVEKKSIYGSPLVPDDHKDSLEN